MNAAQAKTIVGDVQMVDGDTIRIRDVTIRLEGIDAPELNQSCPGQGDLRRCGHAAAQMLSDHIDGRPVRCTLITIDDYERWVARCFLAGGELSVWMVEQGWAMAFRKFSSRLIAEEDHARLHRVGLWQTDFEAPWSYRARRWQVSAQTAPDGCPIKGNISREGERIYHTPWTSHHYARTKITLEKGERWFCSEAEAREAGWRQSR